METAFEIYQRNLDRVSLALWTRNLAMMMRHLSIPNRMTTEDAEIVMTSPEEMEIAMHDFRDQLERIGADWYERRCVEAAFVPGNPDMIHGQHLTFVRKGAGHACAPYRNHMTLLRIGGRWMATSCEAEACNREFQMIAPDMAEGQRREHGARAAAAAARLAGAPRDGGQGRERK